MTDDLLALGDQVICQGVELVVLEATGSFWKPPFYVLEAAGLTVWLVDMLDAVWPCKLAERGMCLPSFVPPAKGRKLRNLTRYRSAVTRECNREKQRMGNLLEDAGIKLSVVASDIFGVSGRAIIEALIAGRRNPGELAKLVRGRMRPKRGELRRALTGRFDDPHAMLARMMLGHIDQLTARIAALDTKIAKAVAEIEAEDCPATDPPSATEGDPATEATPARPGLAERLAEIPGVGTDASRFPSPGHLTSCAGLAPRAASPPGGPSPARPVRATAT